MSIIENENIYFKYKFIYNFNKSYYDIFGELIPKKILNKIYNYYVKIYNNIIESIFYYKIIKNNDMIIDVLMYENNNNHDVNINIYDFILYKHYKHYKYFIY